MVGDPVDLQSIVYNNESDANEEQAARPKKIIHTPRASFHDIMPILIMDTARSESPRSDLADDEFPSNHSATMSCQSIHSSSSFESPRGEP